MSRGPRKDSRSGYHHIVLKAIDTRKLFNDEEDRSKFMSSLYKAKEKGKFEILAYCLMNSHAHLVLKEGELIGESVKRITVSYIWHYRLKYKSQGHILKNRYFSEPIESEDYLMKAIRYTHQNPLKSRIVEVIEDYKWSSYNDYIYAYRYYRDNIETEMVQSIFGSMDSFILFHKEKDDWDMLDKNEIRKYKIRKQLFEEGFIMDNKDEESMTDMVQFIVRNYELPYGIIASILNTSKYKIQKLMV